MITFFDSNVLVYLFDQAEPINQSKALKRLQQAMAHERIVVSTQVLHEFVNVVTRKLKPPMSFAQASERVAQFCQFEVIGSSANSVQAALALAQEHKISWWDALILEAALRADADVLVSEDGQHGQRFGKLVVENPFLA
jgi:predicted nucleic acid-binding protein